MTPSGTAVLLVALGTPQAPETPAVRSFLRQFLSDPRVVDLPRAVWLPILYGAILPFRPARSAAKYRRIWTDAGSPLLVNSRAQAQALQARLPSTSPTGASVVLGMRYGEPSLERALNTVRSMRRIVVVPMYPQYAASTTASILDRIAVILRGWRDLPELHFVRGFADHKPYIDALSDRVQEHWRHAGRGEHLLMSFHGLPQAMVDRGDPYEAECRRTATLLAERLGLRQQQWTLSFQSRLGRSRWLQPYTEPELVRLARSGLRTIDVVCPGFVADCLETIDEIGREAREAFESAGGAQLRRIACLNDHAPWIDALHSLVRSQLHSA